VLDDESSSIGGSSGVAASLNVDMAAILSWGGSLIEPALFRSSAGSVDT